jgi:heptosyltransferase-1
MADILFIKTSSLGDVIHHMPALTEARRMRPDARFAWLAEEAFAALARLHPGVSDVIPVAWRRWRRSLYAPATLREIAQSLSALRVRRFDTVIDTQGLLRTAIMARVATGVRHGYDMRSIREPLGALFYDVRHSVGRGLHAVERNRRLTARALGYEVSGRPDFGLDRAAFAQPASRYAVLLHATARVEKQWPEANWVALGQSLAAQGLGLVLPWGTAEERARSERLAQALPGAQVPDRAPLDVVAGLIAGAELVAGVDTGLLHLAAALSVPLVAIFTGSRPALTGPVGAGPIAIVGTQGATPAVEEVREAVRGLLRLG